MKKEKRHTIFDIKKPVSKFDINLENEYKDAQNNQNFYTKVLIPITSAGIALSVAFAIVDIINKDTSGIIVNFSAAGLNFLILLSHLKSIFKYKKEKNDAVGAYTHKKEIEELLRSYGMTEDQIMEFFHDEPNYIEVDAKEL